LVTDDNKEDNKTPPLQHFPASLCAIIFKFLRFGATTRIQELRQSASRATDPPQQVQRLLQNALKVVQLPEQRRRNAQSPAFVRTTATTATATVTAAAALIADE
jgi:hypothetical protein